MLEISKVKVVVEISNWVTNCRNHKIPIQIRSLHYELLLWKYEEISELPLPIHTHTHYNKYWDVGKSLNAGENWHCLGTAAASWYQQSIHEWKELIHPLLLTEFHHKQVPILCNCFSQSNEGIISSHLFGRISIILLPPNSSYTKFQVYSLSWGGSVG